MDSSTSSPDAALRIVLIDSTTPEAIARCAQQVVRTGEDFELVIISSRAMQLPAGVARKARLVRVAEPEQLEETAAAEAASDRLVVVAPSSSAFSPGWSASVRARAQHHGQVISVVGAHGRSVLVVPPAVTAVTGTRVTWLDPEGIRLREGGTESSTHQTLSAVMIVKDEEAVLAECLSALSPFVDEVVVYDTGSTDATVSIAEAHGAKVILGYWNDHFGDARNRSLEHATGDWVLQIDADEVMTGDVSALRRQLDTEVHDQVSVTIVSTTYKGGTTGVETQPPRIFRRDRYRWTGALHEYPAALAGTGARGMSPLHAPLRLLHSGYQPEVSAARDKVTRNLALSTRELAATPLDAPARAQMLSNQGRTLMWAGKIDEAIAVFEELRNTPGNPASIVIAGRAAVEALLGAQRPDDVEKWLTTLQENGESSGNIAVFRARALLISDDAEGALAQVRSILPGAGGTDTWGVPFDEARIPVVEAAAMMQLGNTDEAATRLVALVKSTPAAVPFSLVVTALHRAGRAFTDVTAVAPPQFLELSLREAAHSHPLLALSWFDAFFTSHPGDLRPVVAGNVFAARAGWMTALPWALRAAEAGITESNALRELSEDEAAPPYERCIALALLSEYFGDEQARLRFSSVLHLVSLAERSHVVSALRELQITSVSTTASPQLSVSVGPGVLASL